MITKLTVNLLIPGSSPGRGAKYLRAVAFFATAFLVVCPYFGHDFEESLMLEIVINLSKRVLINSFIYLTFIN